MRLGLDKHVVERRAASFGELTSSQSHTPCDTALRVLPEAKEVLLAESLVPSGSVLYRVGVKVRRPDSGSESRFSTN